MSIFSRLKINEDPGPGEGKDDRMGKIGKNHADFILICFHEYIIFGVSSCIGKFSPFILVDAKKKLHSRVSKHLTTQEF